MSTTPTTQALLPVTQFLPIETMQLWDVGVVTDWTNAAVSQKAEADDGEHYFAIDPEDGLEWEPTHWAPFPNSGQAHSLPGDVGTDAAAHIDNRLEFAMEELDRECRSAHARGEDGKTVGIAVLRKHFGAALLIIQAEFAPLTNAALRAKLAALTPSAPGLFERKRDEIRKAEEVTPSAPAVPFGDVHEDMSDDEAEAYRATPSALSGDAGEGERDRLVALWHDTDVGNVITLPALLGMTDEQYSAWVRDPSAALPSHKGAGE